MDLFFYLASGVAVVATLMALTRLNAVHSLLYMVVSLLSVALIFFVLGAPYLAALQAIVYNNFCHSVGITLKNTV